MDVYILFILLYKMEEVLHRVRELNCQENLKRENKAEDTDEPKREL
jgi:hypothetical protein